MRWAKRLFSRRRKKVQKTSPAPTVINEEHAENIQDAIMMSSAVHYSNTKNVQSSRSSGCDDSCGSCSCGDSDSGGFDD